MMKKELIKILIAPLLLLPSFALAVPSITDTTFNQKTAAGDCCTSLTFDHTVTAAGNSNQMVAVFCASSNFDMRTGGAATYAGTPMTMKVTNTAQAAYNVFFYLAAPTGGTNSVAVSWTTSTSVICSAFTLKDVVQSGGPMGSLDAYNSSSSGGTASLVTSTTTTAGNGLIFKAGVFRTNGNPTDGAGETQQGTPTTWINNYYFRMTSKNAGGSAQSESVTTDMSPADQGDQIMAVFKDGAVAAAPPPQIPFLLWIFGEIKKVIPTAHAALLTPVEKTLLQKVGTVKLTFQQRSLVIKILNKYHKYRRFITLKESLNWLLTQ